VAEEVPDTRVLMEPVTETPIARPGKNRLVAILLAVFFLVAFVGALVVTINYRAHPVETPPAAASQASLPASQPSLPKSQPALPANQPALPASPPPLPASPAPAPRAAVTEDQSSAQRATAGDVAQRAMPDLLPSAVQSIRGEVNVAVRVAVDAGGSVESASLDSPGPSRYFAKMSLQAAQNWKFKPAQADGKNVASAWILHFKFTQAGTDVTPVQVSP
jgi:TonB family protein